MNRLRQYWSIECGDPNHRIVFAPNPPYPGFFSERRPNISWVDYVESIYYADVYRCGLAIHPNSPIGQGITDMRLIATTFMCTDEQT
jgi:hypothetical protein